MQVPNADATLRLTWDKTSESPASAASAPAASLERAPTTSPNPSNNNNNKEAQRAPPQTNDVLGSMEHDRIETNQWRGNEIRFMRSNEHSRERSGVWNADGLDGPARALVQGDERAPSWLQKLDVVKRVLVDDAWEKKPDTDALANAYIYMQWIATGAIACVEGGGHYRPNHHAELAQVGVLMSTPGGCVVHPHPLVVPGDVSFARVGDCSKQRGVVCGSEAPTQAAVL